jgi:hypothetical protein
MSRTVRSHAKTTLMSSAIVPPVSDLVAEGGYPLATDDAPVAAVAKVTPAPLRPSTPKTQAGRVRRGSGPGQGSQIRHR